MKGNDLKVAVDKWHWHPKNKNFQKSLIESTSICINDNKFIGIPCKNWFQISESILSFSKCISSKYMTYATVFINKNFKNFQEWILHFINSSNRWKIILVANSNINKSISWAEKFFPVPDHLVENWDTEGENLLSKLSEQAKINTIIFCFTINLKYYFKIYLHLELINYFLFLPGQQRISLFQNYPKLIKKTHILISVLQLNL